ncbi:hypothetical protein NLG97_g9756 [Lecanicillium saksenae]|uniref:Uncharacterized protein n=1 Tax=Lecanicillium saksenae TaxID=468837 RepID=A0ACC1QF33_9HYPO|nr:hypothetical protein NLG97_g9756 [Lecanicillium saksenae]
MSHQRYLSHDPIKEPHSVSVKVLRLSCPSLVSQYPLEPPFQAPAAKSSPLPASLAYRPSVEPVSTNPSPFLLSPVLNLPVSFGSAGDEDARPREGAAARARPVGGGGLRQGWRSRRRPGTRRHPTERGLV